jgi:hypothetical protein
MIGGKKINTGIWCGTWKEADIGTLKNICIFLPKRCMRNMKLPAVCRRVPSVTVCTNKPMFRKSKQRSFLSLTFEAPTDGNLRYSFGRVIERCTKILFIPSCTTSVFSNVKLMFSGAKQVIFIAKSSTYF